MAVQSGRKVVHGGYGKRQHEITRKNVLDFSASINPFPPMVSWTCDPFFLSHYPDDTYAELKEVIGQTFHRNPEEICVGNGSMELIRVICSELFGQYHTFFTETPTFGEYECSARLAGAEKSGTLSKADVCFICNPNNPTGTLRSKAEMIAIGNETERHNGVLCADEAFIELADPGQSLADQKDGSHIVLRSLTKCFAVPGLRFGYCFGPPDIIERIDVRRPPWSVNAYAEAFAIQAFRHYDELARSRAYIERERAWLSEHLQALGLPHLQSSANFLLVDTGQKAEELCGNLAEADILVRDCTSFGLPNSIRIAIRTRDENRTLVEALSACLR